ncbi:unnamed protein product, partial [Closterium sp. NIES-53]
IAARAVSFSTFHSSPATTAAAAAADVAASGASGEKAQPPASTLLPTSGAPVVSPLVAGASPLSPASPTGRTVRAVLAGLKQGPKKVNLVAAMVRGMTPDDALMQMAVSIKRAAKTVAKGGACHPDPDDAVFESTHKLADAFSLVRATLTMVHSCKWLSCQHQMRCQEGCQGRTVVSALTVTHADGCLSVSTKRAAKMVSKVRGGTVGGGMEVRCEGGQPGGRNGVGDDARRCAHADGWQSAPSALLRRLPRWDGSEEMCKEGGGMEVRCDQAESGSRSP